MNKTQPTRPGASVFDGHLRPITDGFAFIEAPAEVVAAGYIDWYRRASESRAVLREQLQVSGLSAALRSLPPLFRRGSTRLLFIPTMSDWTACFDNGARGGDPTIWDHFGCEVLKTRTVWHCMRPHTLRKEGDAWTGATGCRMFALYEPSSTNRVRRYLSVELGKGGDYRASGSPLPFEVPDADHARRVQDRLTEEMLLQYLQAVGINAHDDTFYVAHDRRPAHLIQLPINDVEKEGVSLECARDRMI